MSATKSVELEQALIGGLFVRNDMVDEVSAILRPEHMCEEAHAAIYHAVLEAAPKGAFDATMLMPKFEGFELLKDAGGSQYLDDLQSSAIRSAPLLDYAKALLDLFKRRSLISTSMEMAERLQDPDEPLEALMSEFDATLTSLETTGHSMPVLTAQEAMERAGLSIEQEIQWGDYGYKTQWPRLNEIMRAMRPGNFIVVAARPAMGKSAFASEIGQSLASKGKKTLFATLEMGSEELLERIACKDLGLSFLDVEDYAQDLNKQRAVYDWLATKDLSNLWISELSAPNMAQIRAIAKRQKKSTGLDVLFIDYLQLMSGPTKGLTEFAITEFNSKALKALAKELKITIVCLSQLSRAVESRDDKRPKLQDLRNSGSIEQDADKVLMLYRPAYYLEQELPAAIERAEQGKSGASEALMQLQDRLDSQRNILSVGVMKNRRGSTGVADIGWDTSTMRFWSL